ncbi:MAG: NAD-binding protein [Candidatus Hydrogenedentota bacterium]
MRPSIRTLLTGFAFLGGTIAVSVLGYMLLAEASFLDALFMVMITVFSVGYEDVIGLDTPALKVFTLFVIVAGCGSFVYAVGGFAQMVMEGEITRALGARRQIRSIDALRDHAIVCGYGRVGQILAAELLQADYPFVVIDDSEERAQQAGARGILAITGDATDEGVLQSAHIERARSLATVLPDDASNVFITLSARNLNPKLRIFARGELPSTEGKLTKAGANHVVLPAAIGALRLAHMIVRPSASHLIDTLENATMINDDLELLGVRLSEIEVPAGSPHENKTVGELEIAGEGAYLIVALRRRNGEVIRRPLAGAVVEGGDIVIVIGHGEDDPRFVLAKSGARLLVPSDPPRETAG